MCGNIHLLIKANKRKLCTMNLNLGNVDITPDTNILSIDVPKELETNVPTGMAHIDRLFGGDGITPSTASLITGIPGSGKTTVMLQLADSLTGQGHVCLYNTTEESLYQVRRVTKRLGLTNGFIVGQDKSIYDILEHIEGLRAKAAPGQKVILIQDSIQCLEIPRIDGQKGRPLSGDKATLASLAFLVKWAKETYNIFLGIGQVTKEGQFAGKNTIRHAVDCHMHLGYEIDQNGKETPIIEMTKNRFGPSGLYYNFNLSETGFKFIDNGR